MSILQARLNLKSRKNRDLFTFDVYDDKVHFRFDNPRENKEKDIILFDLIKENKFDEIQVYFTSIIANYNHQDVYGQTCIHIALKYDRYAIAEKIINIKKVDLNLQNILGQTVLMEAVKKGNVDFIKFLLDKKSNLNLQDSKGQTALMHSIKNSSFELVDLIIQKGKPKVNLQDKEGRTALMEAVRYERLNIVKLLVQKANADIDIQDSKGITALMEAVRKNRIDIAKLLIKTGKCNVKLKNIDNQTAQDILEEFQPGMSL